jgi:hypothetical protein
LRSKVQIAKDGVKFAAALAYAVLLGINNRYGNCFDDGELILAAITLPQLRLR